MTYYGRNFIDQPINRCIYSNLIDNSKQLVVHLGALVELCE